MMDDPARPLYERLGGHATIERVHEVFYEKVYRHPWLRQFFADIDRKTIETQQTDFMAQAMGGPARYCGKFPIPAHKHMFITAELFEIRHVMLEDSLREAGVPEALAAQWLGIDAAFKARLVKQSPSECEGRFRTDPIIVIPKTC